MQKYNCKTCGAELYWDANSNALKCEYCDSSYQPSDFETVTENDANADEAAQQTDASVREADEYETATDESSKVDDLVVYKCEHCGAEVITARSTVATLCAFCGRAITLTNKMVGNFKPESVIPFSVNNESAVKAYKEYCKKAWLLPKKFLEESEIQKIKGVYVPYWLHSTDIAADVDINASTTSSRRRGDDKIVTHQRYRVHMNLEGEFTNVPTDALKHLDNELMDGIAPFDYGKLSDFNPAFMAGFYAEEYDESKEDAFARALSHANDAMKEKALQNAGTYTSKVIGDYSSQHKNDISKYAMFPAWLLSVDYKDKIHLFAVNGETGKTAGKLPMSIPKLCAFAGGVFVGSQLVALIVRLIAALS